MPPHFIQFLSTFIYALWHDQSFTYLTNYPTHGLLEFQKFIVDLLGRIKISFSVIILALKYIHRIKCRCPHIQGKPGSEYRLFVCTLILAMKYLADNVYPNRAWHSLSRIPLIEINLAEIEFMVQLGYDLHVTEQKYFGWLIVVDDAFQKYRGMLNTKSGQCLTPPLDSPVLTTSNDMKPFNKLR